MTKRLIIGIVCAILIIVGSVFYFLKENQPIADSLYKAVPLDAALIFEIKSYDEFRDQVKVGKGFWDEICYLPMFGKLNEQLVFLDSMRKSCQPMDHILSQNQQVLVSGHPTGKDDLQLIYFFRISADKDFKQMTQQLLDMRGTRFEHSVRTYEQAEIHDITFPNHRNESFSFTHCNGILMVSHSSILLEDAVRQLNSVESILNNAELAETMKTAGKNSLMNIYANFDYLPRLAMKLVHPKFKKTVEMVKKFGKWIELDLNPKPGVLIFNGFSTDNSTKPGLSALFKNQKPLKPEFFNKVPAETNSFAALCISDFDQYIKDYEVFQEMHGNIQSYRTKLQSLKEDFHIDLLGSLHATFEQEVGTVFWGSAGDSIENQCFTLIRTKGGDEAHKMLYDFVSEYANKSGIPYGTLVNEYKKNDQTRKTYALPFGNIPELFFGSLFSTGENKYCTVIDNYMVFGNSMEAVNNFADVVTENNTLGTDPDFLNFSDYFSAQTNFFFYNKPEHSRSFYSNFLKTDILNVIEKQEEHFNRLNTFAYQCAVSGNGLIYNTLFVRYSESGTEKKEEQEPVENPVKSIPAKEENKNEFSLEGKAAIKPFYIKSGGDLETFVQDEKNQIYLLDKNGKTLWKVQISDKIISEIYLVDYFKNGKQQLLFNTSKQLILIDRKGNFVENYPITFSTKVSNGVAVFDYENDRNYRLFVAGANHTMMALDKAGKPIKGWNAIKATAEITQPMQHFRVEGKDFLVFCDKNRMYIMDRKGKESVKAKTKFTVSLSCKPGLINSKSLKDARFVFTDQQGKIHQIGLDGNDKTLDIGKLSPAHYFDVYDLNNDGVKEFIVTSGNQIVVYNQSGKTLTTITTPSEISCRPTFYEFATNKFEIGVVNIQDEKIYLYKPNGKLEKGFPLRGSTQFSIKLLNNSENKLNLIVGSPNNFLYNYSVQ